MKEAAADFFVACWSFKLFPRKSGANKFSNQVNIEALLFVLRAVLKKSEIDLVDQGDKNLIKRNDFTAYYEKVEIFVTILHRLQNFIATCQI